MVKLVVGNLKANILTLPERERYLAGLEKNFSGKKFINTEVVICPPFVHLENFARANKNKLIKIGAQNIFWEERGSFTGEVTAQMIKNLGADFVIVGHSERRRYFGETSEIANLKIKNTLKNGLTAIYCVGETSEEREEGRMKEIITEQLSEGLEGIAGTKLEKIIVAYEPVWAVGSDMIPTSNEVMEVRILIKKTLAEKYGMKSAEKVRILYGGSVKAKHVWQLSVEPGMNGVLVGRESLVPAELAKIAEIINNS